MKQTYEENTFWTVKSLSLACLERRLWRKTKNMMKKLLKILTLILSIVSFLLAIGWLGRMDSEYGSLRGREMHQQSIYRKWGY